jgi:hypothetical protein
LINSNAAAFVFFGKQCSYAQPICRASLKNKIGSAAGSPAQDIFINTFFAESPENKKIN